MWVASYPTRLLYSLSLSSRGTEKCKLVWAFRWRDTLSNCMCISCICFAHCLSCTWCNAMPGTQGAINVCWMLFTHNSCDCEKWSNLMVKFSKNCIWVKWKTVLSTALLLTSLEIWLRFLTFLGHILHLHIEDIRPRPFLINNPMIL